MQRLKREITRKKKKVSNVSAAAGYSGEINTGWKVERKEKVFLG